MRKTRVIVGALLATLMPGCRPADSGAGPSSAAPAVPVAVGTATKSDVPVLLRTIGTVESPARIILKPQVAGRIAELAASEGTDVQADQALLRLDARPFEAVLQAMEADLAQATTLAVDARRAAERNRSALASAALSQRESEEAQAKADAADAEVLAKRADVETARLNLAYCVISAPFAGRLGQFMVKPGSIVKANETDLVELAQIDPIETTLSIPEKHLAALRAAASAGTVRVEVLPSGDTGEPAVGTLTFIDNRVDPDTGTIRLKGTFPNAARRLWPGQFTNVTLVLGTETGCVMVPESAVQPSQAGPAIFVVKADKTVELRTVTVRRSLDGRSVIESGIEAGETVVTDGQLRLAPGTAVQIKNEPPKPAQG